MFSHKKWLLLVAMTILVPIAGEIQFYPYPGAFRISFGTPIFLFFLLYFRQLPPKLSGLLVGLAVVLFRICLDLLSGMPIEVAVGAHGAVFFYYSSYGFLFRLMNIRNYYQAPLIMGTFASMIEIVSTCIEVTIRFLFSDITVSILGVFTVIVIAIIRSFFVMGFFMIIMYHDLKIKEREQREKNEQILLIIANLYIETIQLKKSITTAETVTRDCYNLYRELKDMSCETQGKKALKIAGEVHECKKDNQRIYAGLSKLMQTQTKIDDLEIQEIIDVIVHTNKKYASHLDKEITFEIDIIGNHPRYHAFFILSILNNLVANSLEAIKQSGKIYLKAILSSDHQKVTFYVIDNGPGIEPKRTEFIFTPGYTTKYDTRGEPSNGIGLSYVKSAIEEAGGDISLVESSPFSSTAFKIVLPTNT